MHAICFCWQLRDPASTYSQPLETPSHAQDLALYKKFRNKEVASAARGLIGLFRELAPGMLEKKDRGRGAELDAKPLGYGASRIATRVEGAELLQVGFRAP